MVLVAGCLGLRASEVTGLQWQDLDWDALTVSIRRGVVHGREGEAKTEASEKPIPLDADLAAEILSHRARSAYTEPTDFVFAGDSGKPRWQEMILADHIKPAALSAGIQGKVGWHTLRHTYSTLLRAHGTDVKVQQETIATRRHIDNIEHLHAGCFSAKKGSSNESRQGTVGRHKHKGDRLRSPSGTNWYFLGLRYGS